MCDSIFEGVSEKVLRAWRAGIMFSWEWDGSVGLLLAVAFAFITGIEMSKEEE